MYIYIYIHVVSVFAAAVRPASAVQPSDSLKSLPAWGRTGQKASLRSADADKKSVQTPAQRERERERIRYGQFS